MLSASLILMVGLATFGLAFYQWRRRRDEEAIRQHLEAEVAERTQKLQESLVAVRQSEERFALRTNQLETEVIERRHAEILLQAERERLSLSEQKFIRTFDQAPIGASIVSLDGRYIRVNREFERITGFQEAELQSLAVSDITHPDDRLASSESARRLLGDEVVIAEEVKRYIRKDGRLVWVRVSVRVVKDNFGNPIFFLPMMFDITDDILRDSELKERKDQLNLVLDGSDIGFWDWNIEEGAVQRNKRWAEMLGYTINDIEFTVKQWVDFIHDDDKENAQKSISDHLNGTTPHHKIEYRMRTKSGEYRWILDQARVVKRSSDGAPLRMSGTHTDITDRKLAEAELIFAKERAEITLKELRETQTALVQSEKMAALGHLTAGVAHEINTPLGIILTTITHCSHEANIIKEKVEDGKLRKTELVQFITDVSDSSSLLVSNIERASELIKSFQHIAADQASGERRSFNLLPWLKDIAIGLRPEWHKKGHNIVIDCPSELYLDSYPGMLAQILTNLIINSVTHAFRAGEHGTLRISITEQDDQNIRLLYTDDGTGIPKKLQSRVFEPFFTTNREAGNTGLGLHIVYNLVTNGLGGRISLESDCLNGTRFAIDLPRNAPLNQNCFDGVC